MWSSSLPIESSDAVDVRYDQLLRQIHGSHKTTQRPSSIKYCNKWMLSWGTPDPVCVGPFTTEMFSFPWHGAWLLFTFPSVSSFFFISGDSCTLVFLSESCTWSTAVSIMYDRITKKAFKAQTDYYENTLTSDIVYWKWLLYFLFLWIITSSILLSISVTCLPFLSSCFHIHA